MGDHGIFFHRAFHGALADRLEDFQNRVDLAEVRPTFLRWSRIAALITLLMGSYILIVGPQFLARWVEAGDTSGRILQVLMASGRN